MGHFLGLEVLDKLMTWRCKDEECLTEVEWDEKTLAKKGEPVCPVCDGDMESIESFTYNICAGSDGRIVSTFEIKAADQDKAQELAEEEFEDFANSLRLENE